MRGEYCRFDDGVSKMAELPPRARRILADDLVDGIALGTTSACAENTPRCNPCTPKSRNYLRVRGEYISGTPLTPPNRELPPRARRILRYATSARRALGTTSACAENTKTSQKGWCPTGNYLRVRGEYSSYLASSTCMMELPPRARRIPPIKGLLPALIGTTSACAENTRPGVPCTGDQGELPPRARRIQRPAKRVGALQGTTSACAENTHRTWRVAPA